MKRNRRRNELFIGSKKGNDFLSVEGRTVKHPSLIEHHANINPSKSRETMISLIGLDLETNYKTGDLRLMGFYEGNSDDYGDAFDDNGNPIAPYRYYTEDFFENFVATVKYAMNTNRHLAYWSSLDASQIVKMFIKQNYKDYVVNDVFERYKKIAGEYDKTQGKWVVRPVISIDTGLFVIGIKQAIRDSLQFFMQKPNGDVVECWGYNIKALYMKGLEAEADADSGGRFDWYSKIGDEAHLLAEEEWERFKLDEEFRSMVLESNKLDAKSAMALGYEIQKDFNNAFKFEDETGVLNSYPTSLISQGSQARSAVGCQIRNDLIEEYGFKVKDISIVINPKNKQNDTRKELMKGVRDKLNSIPLRPHLDKWLDKYPEPIVKDLYSMTAEAYSGGYIDSISYGYTETAYIADIASAYPSVIQNLWDLTDAELKYGEGEPPSIPYSYVFCRGLVNIPKGVDFQPITIKQKVEGLKDTNVRFEGKFYASYTKDERDFVESIGGTFEGEKWVAVITKGLPAVQSKVSVKLGDLRDYYLSINDRTEALVKRINNSGYGILFEATPLYEEIDGEPLRIGYRGGEFFNPLYASIITARTRIIISSASYEIKKNGGKICVIMTDSITWEGTEDMLPKVLPFSWGESGIKEKKTFGYFEPPIKLKNLVVMGAGLYGYDIVDEESDKVSYKVNKRRGFNISDILDENEDVLDVEFTWYNILKQMREQDSNEANVSVRRMISVGILAHQKETYTVDDLGRVLEENKKVPIISGRGKRLLKPYMYDAELLMNEMVKTDALYVTFNSDGSGDYVDGTLPVLREEMNKLTMMSGAMIQRENSRKRQKRFYDKNKKSMKDLRKEKYDLAREGGFNSNDSKLLMGWNKDKLVKLLHSKLSIDEFLEKEGG